jgi:hypothetical protein
MGRSVGFLGALKFSEYDSQLWTAIAGGLLTTYCTFLPSFMFIFAGAPYISIRFQGTVVSRLRSPAL